MWMREAEVKHARLAMLAAAGWPLAELWHGGLSNLLGLPYELEVTQGRSLSVLNGGLGEVAPFMLAVALAISVVEVKTLDQVYGLTATGKTMKPDGTIVMKIEQEASSLAASSAGAADLITNKRTISTRVLIEDGGTVVLGGLIQDSQTGGEQRVPFLGRIPFIGEAFRTRSAKKNKTNLMVFIRPNILRDSDQVAVETEAKYNYLRGIQTGRTKGRAPMLPGERQPTLPAMEQLSPPAAPTKPAAPATAAAPATVTAPVASEVPAVQKP
jgi:hypothetical protein